MPFGRDAAPFFGRQKVKSLGPLVILDGAHNVDKMKTTAEFVCKFKYKKLHLIIGLAKNKDAEGILKEIIPLADKVYLTRFLHQRRKTQYLGKMTKFPRRKPKVKSGFILIRLMLWRRRKRRPAGTT